MSQNKQKTALLVFTLTPKREFSSKNLHSERSKNYQLLRQFYRHTIKNARSAGLPVIVHDESMQHGESFEKRLANAIEDVFLKGFERVIITGNDSPDLNTADIIKADVLLENNDIVLGPDFRGGTYLIGFRKDSYVREEFLLLDWQTNSFYNSYINYACDRSLAMASLGKKADFNKAADFLVYQHVSTASQSLMDSAQYKPTSSTVFLHALSPTTLTICKRGP